MQEALREIGFDEKEAELYITLLRLGGAPVAQLKEKTDIERRTIYDVLNRLINDGRASHYQKDGKRHYAATKPAVILASLRQKQQEFEAIIPQLRELQEPKEASVEILKGTKGLRTIFFEIIEQEATHYAFGDITPFISDEQYTPYVEEFLRYLETREIQERIIYPRGQPVQKITSGEYRALDEDLVPPTPTIVYGDVTVQFVFAQPLTIIKITGEQVAQTHRAYFQAFWEQATPG